MAWYRFTADHVFTPKIDRRWSKKFKAGCIANLTREQAEHATAAGKAERTTAPRRKVTA